MKSPAHERDFFLCLNHDSFDLYGCNIGEAGVGVKKDSLEISRTYFSLLNNFNHSFRINIIICLLFNKCVYCFFFYSLIKYLGELHGISCRIYLTI